MAVQMNVADSEVVASIMQMAGYTLCDTIEDSDAIFVNTCSIRDNAEQKVLSRLSYFQSLRKHKKSLVIGVLGCMAERVREQLITENGWEVVKRTLIPSADCATNANSAGKSTTVPSGRSYR